MMERFIRLMLVVMGLPVLVACSEPPTGYFPLQAGLQWTYRVTIERKSGVTHKQFDVRALGERGKGDTRGFVRRTSAGTDYILRRDDTGIFRVAKRTVVEDTPKLDEEPRYVLQYPLEVGKGWNALTHSYVIQRFYPPTEETLSGGTNFYMSYSILSTSETVKVPAGTFTDCILVEGNANMDLFVGAVNGFSEVPIITREWYAEGVGLVKLERIEVLETEIFSGGTMRFELSAFER